MTTHHLVSSFITFFIRFSTHSQSSTCFHFRITPRLFQHPHVSSPRCAVQWSAPEALRAAQYTTQSDVWSFGVVMWEAGERGALPYKGMTNAEAVKFVEVFTAHICRHFIHHSANTFFTHVIFRYNFLAPNFFQFVAIATSVHCIISLLPFTRRITYLHIYRIQ